ncbi:MAG: helix-hairpin-helix domain-containing protein [Acidimicrobiia bacterium]
MESFSEFRNIAENTNIVKTPIRPAFEPTNIEKIKEYIQNNFLKIVLITVGVFIIFGYFLTQKSQTSTKSEQINIPTSNTQLPSTTRQVLMKVYVTGAVNKPSVVEIDTKSRVIDAIEKAGGPKSEANLAHCDLAAFVQDGSTIRVPSMNESNLTCLNASIGQGEIGSTQETQNTNSKINLNTASQSELETLPGVGPSLASSIIQYRKTRGYKSINDLRNVKGIGDKRFSDLKDLVSI